MPTPRSGCRRMTAPFLLRRRKHDPEVLPDLPPRQDSTEFCTLTVEQAGFYQATIDTMLGGVQRVRPGSTAAAACWR